MIRKFLALSMTLTALLMSVTSCKKYSDKRNNNTTTTGSVVMACDETFQKIMEQEIDVFEFIYDASVLPRWMPENECIDSILYSKTTRLAVITRELTQPEITILQNKKRQPRQTRIAVDAIAVIANPENPIETLTVSDLGKILSGEITEWRWVETGNTTGDISIVFDYAGSSTVNYMRDSIMDGRPFGQNVYAQNDNAKVFETVTKMKGALGIIGVSWVSSDMSTAELTIEERVNNLEVNDTTQITFLPDVKVLGIAKDELSLAYKPYQAYIYDGTYPLFRSVYMVTTGAGGTLAGGFYSFVTGFQGQKLIQQTGVLPGSISPRIVQVE